MIFHLHHHHQHCLLVLLKVWAYLPHHHQEDFLNLFNHLYQDQIIPLVILIFQYNRPQVSTIKNYLEIYLVHRQTLTREKEKVIKENVQKELDDTIYELLDLPKLELGDGFLNTLGVEGDDILDQEFVNKKQQEDEVLEQIKKAYTFDEIKDAFLEGTVPQQLDFFYSGENSNFNGAVEF